MLKNRINGFSRLKDYLKKDSSISPLVKGGVHLNPGTLESLNPSFNKGFTLLEVLVAVSILAISGVTAMQVISQVLKNISKTKEYSFTAITARNELEKLSLRDDIKGEENGDIERADYKVKYAITRIEVENASYDESEVRAFDPFFDKYEIAVTVSGKDSPAKKAFTLKTLKLINKETTDY